MSRKRSVGVLVLALCALAALAGRFEAAPGAKGKPDQKMEIIALDA